MKTKHLTICLVLLSLNCLKPSFAQINFTANDKVPAYNNNFLYGIGGDYYEGWNDEQLAEISAGAPLKKIPGLGVASLRLALFEYFLEYWGYNIRVNTFKYYESLGIKDNACIIGYPIEGTDKNIFHREKKSYCEKRSELFENMYTDIWDGGANGTPVNDQNYYALYLYKMVNAYKGKIKFWGVWNEPDLSGKGWLPKGQAGNWWDSNPLPCDMPNINTPIFNYIRLLRISYEVIKYVDPQSYVSIGGIGYPSFLDAVLRNTDNPDNGKVSNAYPLKGGAYFDVLDYHSYPHVEGNMRFWDNSIGGFKYIRHSDEAIKSISKKKDEFTEVLAKYGYGSTYPQKVWTITESNIPRKMTGEDYGGEVAQRNFIVKGAIHCQRNGISQWYIYQTADRMKIEDVKDMNGEFAVMGLYNTLKGVQPYNQVINTTGIAHKTMSDALLGKTIDLARTAQLNLGDKIDGAAFVKDGKYTYALWAKTNTDKSEVASATYSFPASLGITSLERRNWDQSKTKLSTNINSSNISLSSEPIFLIDNNTAIATEDILENNKIQLDFFPNPAQDLCNIKFSIYQNEPLTISIYDSKGVFITNVIENMNTTSGSYNYEWNTSGLTSGIYQCKLSTPSFSISKKISVIK
ncbi:MAG: T9SS C-terminal target domain-containing protein [Cytophagales bacterium]|nr:MAG: T9SS C-terminal target domain-containing protein [Cytophagales bacterium]